MDVFLICFLKILSVIVPLKLDTFVTFPLFLVIASDGDSLACNLQPLKNMTAKRDS